MESTLTYEIGRKFNDRHWPCMEAVKWLYETNGIKTVLDEQTTGEWVRIASSGFREYESRRVHKLAKGRLIVFLLPNGRWHVGAYLGRGKFFHAHDGYGAVGKVFRFKDSIKGIFEVTA